MKDDEIVKMSLISHQVSRGDKYTTSVERLQFPETSYLPEIFSNARCTT